MQNSEIGQNQFAGLFDERVAEEAVTLSWDVRRYALSVNGEVYVAGKDVLRTGFPLADDDLFLSFARLGAQGNPSPNRVLGWVRQHGLLTLGDDGRGGQAPISLTDFRAEVRQAHGMLRLYAELKGGDAKAVAERLEAARPPFDVARGRDWRLNSRFGAVRYMLRNTQEMLREDVDLFAGYDALAEALTSRLDGVTIRLDASFPDLTALTKDAPKISESAYGLTQGWSCPDLLSGLYLQFYLMIYKNRRMRRCDSPICGLPFPLTRTDKRFCNDTCRSNARHRR